MPLHRLQGHRCSYILPCDGERRNRDRKNDAVGSTGRGRAHNTEQLSYAGHRPLVNGFGFLFVRSTFLESSREGGAFRKQPPSRHGCTGQKKSAMGTREAAAPRPDVFSPSASAIVRRMLASSYVLLKLAGSPAVDWYASLLRALTTTVST